MSVWGPIVDGKHVTDAIVDTLKTWLRPSFAAVVRSHGLDPQSWPAKTGIPEIRTWRRMTFGDLYQAGVDQLPAVFASTSGAPFLLDEDGALEATWRCTVTVAARGSSYDETADIVKMLTAAARIALVQHPSLGGLARTLTPLREEFDAIETAKARTLGAGFVDFDVVAEAVTDSTAGPSVPPADPLAAAPDVSTFDEAELDVHPIA